MKTIIAGSRSLDTYKDEYKVKLVADAVISSGFEVTEVVCGGCRGIDLAGKAWAEASRPEIPVRTFTPEWDRYGKGAGPIRNSAMAAYGDALILIWNGTSRGSKDMLTKAQISGLKIYQHVIP